MLHLKGDLLLGGLMISQSIEKSKSCTNFFTKKITPLVSDVYQIYILSPRWRCCFNDAFNRTEEEMHSFGFVTVLSG